MRLVHRHGMLDDVVQVVNVRPMERERRKEGRKTENVWSNIERLAEGSPPALLEPDILARSNWPESKILSCVPRFSVTPDALPTNLRLPSTCDTVCIRLSVAVVTSTLQTVHDDFPEGCAAIAAAMYVCLSPSLFRLNDDDNSLTGCVLYEVAVQTPSSLALSMAKFASPAAIATGRYMQMRYLLSPIGLVGSISVAIAGAK
jgi:hypothetical protein